MNEHIKTLIGWWQVKGQKESDPFVKFFIFYVCFDAWITAESGKDSDRGKLHWFTSTNNCLKERRLDFWRSPQTQALLKSLQMLSPVEDMRPNHRGEYKALNDINSLEEVVNFIYQIRCNLFHGSKSPMADRDAQLVDLSGRLLEKWITWALHKCQ
jgi:hypothetical protein